MPAEPARTAVTGAQGSNPGLPEPGFGGSYVNTPAAWRNGAVGAISIAVGPGSSDPGDQRSTHLPLASTTHSADARPATPVTIGIASAATRSVPRTLIAPRSTPNRRVPTRTAGPATPDPATRRVALQPEVPRRGGQGALKMQQGPTLALCEASVGVAPAAVNHTERALRISTARQRQESPRRGTRRASEGRARWRTRSRSRRDST